MRTPSYRTSQHVKAHKSKAAKEVLSAEEKANTQANEAADKAAKDRAQRTLPDRQLLHEEAREQ